MSRGEETYSSDVFQILFEYEVARSLRYPAPLTLLKIEMTSYIIKEEAPEIVSSTFSTALNQYLRSVDIPSKNGNMYTVLLPTSDGQGAHAVCDRLISVFKKKLDSPAGNPISFSLQIGATSHSGGESISGEAILQKAEEALRQSKLKGTHTYVIL